MYVHTYICVYVCPSPDSVGATYTRCPSPESVGATYTRCPSPESVGAIYVSTYVQYTMYIRISDGVGM